VDGDYSVALNAAEQRIDAGTAAMLINTGPILIAILAGFVLREGFPPGLFAGCAVAFAGCVMIGLATTRSGTRAGLGIALCVVAALAYALAVVAQKPVLARVSSFQVTGIGYLIPVVAIGLGWAVLGETPPWLAAAGGALCLIGVSVARRAPRS
jgi:drug/metabolite transporter (DMT)-like permease